MLPARSVGAPRAITSLVVAVLCSSGASGVSAQQAESREVAQGPWAVLGTVPLFGVSDVERVVLQLSADGAIPGAVVIAPSEAIRRFETAHSQPPELRSATEIAELESCAREMGLQLARGRIAAAGAHLDRCEELLSEVRRSYDTHRESEQRIFRACMVLLQGMLANGPRERALRHAEMCRLDAVDLPVEREWASPEVQDLMSEIDASLSARERAVVRVYGAADGCDVWLRGRMIGRTPVVAHGVLAGAATLQLVCPGRSAGRAHHVMLVPGDNYLAVDHLFESSLRTDQAMVLDYGATWIESIRRLDDARVIGEAIGARVVVLATMLPDGSALRLDRLDLLSSGVRVNASVLLPVTGGILRPEHLEEAGRALTELRSVDLSGTTPRSIEPWSPPVAPRGPETASAH